MYGIRQTGHSCCPDYQREQVSEEERVNITLKWTRFRLGVVIKSSPGLNTDLIGSLAGHWTGDEASILHSVGVYKVCLPSPSVPPSILPSVGVYKVCLPSPSVPPSILHSVGVYKVCLPSPSVPPSILHSVGVYKVCLSSPSVPPSILHSVGVYKDCLPSPCYAI
jgi:hypothetical protein